MIHHHSEDKVKNTYATNALMFFFLIFFSFKQAFKFSSVEKLDNVLTLLLKSKISAYEFSPFQSEEHHQQGSESLLVCIYFYY